MKTRLSLVILLLAPAPLLAQDPWAEFRPGTFATVVRTERTQLDLSPRGENEPTTNVSARTYPERVTVVLTGAKRPLSEGSVEVLKTWARGIGGDSTFAARFTDEVQVLEDGAQYWVPVQRVWEGDLAREFPAPTRVTFLTRWLGTYQRGGAPQWVFVANEFEAPPFDAPPSQYELNGFLLGQHNDALVHAFGAPFQTIPHEDGWIDRAYGVSREHHAYMAFKFAPDPKDIAVAVQIAGDASTPMRPFLGIHLGSTRKEVEARFGAPSEVSHEDDVNVDLLTWAGRNYSFEVDTAGIVNSIQILGYDGLRDEAMDSEPDPLARFRRVLASGDVDSLLVVVGPDVECYRDTTVTTFTQSPRSDLGTATSPLRRCFAALAAPIATPASDVAVRVQEPAVGLVYKWARGPVQELFFKWFPGGYRLWEARLR